MADWLQRQWYCLSVWHLVLIPLSWLFRLLVALRRLAYRVGLFKSFRLNVPVIVVGNITVGGTGKTPFVIWLVQQLQAAGFKPGVISRGYGVRNSLPLEVTAQSRAQEVGDEPLLIASRIDMPVFVCRDRVAAARALLVAHPTCDLLISDDGLQHYRLQRDIEIAVVDGQRQFGNGQLLPAGPLREPVSRMQEVDAVVCNGGMAADYPNTYRMQLQAALLHQVSRPANTLDVDALQGKRLLAVAGIGNPERFFAQLRRMGLVFETRVFPDHHPYQAQDLQTQGIDAILMTEKDAVKCRAFADEHCWYLPVEAELQDGLLSCIMSKLRK